MHYRLEGSSVTAIAPTFATANITEPLLLYSHACNMCLYMVKLGLGLLLVTWGPMQSAVEIGGQCLNQPSAVGEEGGMSPYRTKNKTYQRVDEIHIGILNSHLPRNGVLIKSVLRLP